VQNKVNQSLKQISQTWRLALSEVQNVSNADELSKQEEFEAIKIHLSAGIEDMVE
jgi:hypothetical protein